MNTLTPTERRVLGLIAQGCTDRQIAARVHLSHWHVTKYVVANIRLKLGARNRAHAVWLAVRSGELGVNGKPCSFDEF